MKVLTERKVLSLTPETVQRIDDLRYVLKLPTESETFRRVIEKGLHALEAQASNK
ncbi:hypothetical protein [Curvivirga aplysinae]|uniref:hypothetical protein n=1 Tax=Curvivirga aplysinae TaxID=2529852 RepID=UPI0012BD78FB|nr:hypothetical protein [Curvivirga aplysinae]